MIYHLLCLNIQLIQIDEKKKKDSLRKKMQVKYTHDLLVPLTIDLRYSNLHPGNLLQVIPPHVYMVLVIPLGLYKCYTFHSLHIYFSQ